MKYSKMFGNIPQIFQLCDSLLTHVFTQSIVKSAPRGQCVCHNLSHISSHILVNFYVKENTCFSFSCKINISLLEWSSLESTSTICGLDAPTMRFDTRLCKGDKWHHTMLDPPRTRLDGNHHVYKHGQTRFQRNTC